LEILGTLYIRGSPVRSCGICHPQRFARLVAGQIADAREISAIPLGECQQCSIGQLAGVQPLGERKAALPACQVERQRTLDDGSRRLELEEALKGSGLLGSK
jgi:hypothetical protein